ncbi:hypothetical protein BD289DRAFT_437538 [Coniella lustricola]|uniref:Uncharacterized protein n=1 Tax=Coniella lustricola TaxID=2025994 RepID=A0A2T3A3T8_9PEZI|nr:hypothetical protein BD289DRAFT_437538 [Coniella lustricola]
MARVSPTCSLYLSLCVPTSHGSTALIHIASLWPLCCSALSRWSCLPTCHVVPPKERAGWPLPTARRGSLLPVTVDSISSNYLPIALTSKAGGIPRKVPRLTRISIVGFQAPFTSSPYGPNVPSTAAPQGQYNPNYMMANQMAGYPMNAQQQHQQHQQQQQQHQQQQQQPQQPTPQQQQHPQHPQHHHQQQQQHQHQLMMQRMHQAQQNQASMGTPNPQRQFSTPQGTPNPMQPQGGHYGAPQGHPGPPQLQTPAPAPPSAHSVTTPQTPTFPSTGQSMAMNGSSTPISPGTQARDQERMSLLLEINTELLFEVIHLKQSLEEIRKELASGQNPNQQKEAKEEEESLEQDYNQVFRRLQANLAYLANLTTNKPGVPRQPAPMILSPPPLNLKLKLRAAPSGTDADKGGDGSEDREERGAYIEDLYKRLHGLFPGIDPNKETIFRPHMKPGGPNPAMAVQNAQRMASIAAAQGQMPGNAAPSPAPSTHQTTPQMAPVQGLPSTQPSMGGQ